MPLIKYLIYVLKHPVTKEIRYVGYTSKSLKVRLRYHYYELEKKGYSHKRHWLRSLPKKAIIEKIDECYDLDTVKAKEQFYISLYPNLVNSTTGGESNKVLCEDVRKRIGEKMKGKLVGERNPMFGKKRPDLKARNLTNNPMNNPDVKKKAADKLREMYNTPEYKEIHCKSQKTRKSVVKIGMDGVVLKTYPSIKRVTEDGFDSSCVSDCCNGIYKQHKGFKWAFALHEKAA